MRNRGWVKGFVECGVADMRRHLDSRIIFKPNRAAALAEWRPLLIA